MHIFQTQLFGCFDTVVVSEAESPLLNVGRQISSCNVTHLSASVAEAR